MSKDDLLNNSDVLAGLDFGLPPVSVGPGILANSEDRASKYLTRRQAAHFICTELGRPFSFSTATKLSAQGEFAKPTLWWGRRPLYTRDDLRAWVASRERHTRPPRENTGRGPRGKARPAASRKA